MLATLATAALAMSGQSVEGRPLDVVHRGDREAPLRALVVGQIHGDEPGGRSIANAVLRATPPEGVQAWVVRDLNPDGRARRTRQNANGVDLNRNFPHRWRATRRKGRYWPGPRAASEPETRWAMRLIRTIRPHVTLWLHQPYGFVVPSEGVDRAVLRRYATTAGLSIRRLPRYRGTATGWQNTRLEPSGGAFVVELKWGRQSRATIRRHVRALWAAVLPPAQTAQAEAQEEPAEEPEPAAEKPPIRWDPIPYGAKRRGQMRRYARRHYGIDTHRLENVRTIVQHFTAGDTYAGARNHFAANRPDLGELPGTCSHFIVDKDGTISQLARLGIMCRHVVGLNHVSVGIEHVGRSDGQVMGNRRQREASLRLTRWLQDRYDVPTRHVIGHAESLSSPFHHERVRAWRRLTHGDFKRRTMRRYRGLL